MVNLLLDKAGFDVVKASSVPPGFNKQGTGENRGNIYYGRSVDLVPHITKHLIYAPEDEGMEVAMHDGTDVRMCALESWCCRDYLVVASKR
jgi:hypothetical protein